MYVGVPLLVYMSWLVAVGLLGFLAVHRCLLVWQGRRDMVNWYLAASVSLGVLFLVTRYPSPVRWLLDLLAPRETLYFNYSIVIWCLFAVLGVGRGVFGLGGVHRWLCLALCSLVQVGTFLAFRGARLEQPFSLSAEARAGDGGSLWFLVQMVALCSVGAIYLVVLLLVVARGTGDRWTRRGQLVAAGGLVVLVLACVEETLFLVGVPLSMRVHGVAIEVFLGVGMAGLALGLVLLSPWGRQALGLLRDTWLYMRVRRVARRVATVWPEVSLWGPGGYAWWTVFDLWHVRGRLVRAVVEWQELRRRLVAYLADEVLPVGEAGVEGEARFLALGLAREGLARRAVVGCAESLALVPDEVEAAASFLGGVGAVVVGASGG